MECLACDEPALLRWGEQLGALLRPGHVVLLDGPMGAGKTTFTRALGRGLGLQRPERVCSPTFNICLVHPGPTPLVHIDLFRLAPEGLGGDVQPASFEALGLDALLDEVADVRADDVDARVGALVIEWADLWFGEAGPEALRIRLARPDPAHRDLRASAVGGAHRELLDRWERSARPSS